MTINNKTPHDDLFGAGGTVYTIKLMLISLGFIDDDEMIIPASMVGDLLDDIKDDTEENHQKIIDVAPNSFITSFRESSLQKQSWSIIM